MRIEGQSIRAIARELGVDPKTVRAVLRRKERQRKPRPSLLDPFRPLIRSLVLEKELTAVRVHEEIEAVGYKGGYAILRGCPIANSRVFQLAASRRAIRRTMQS